MWGVPSWWTSWHTIAHATVVPFASANLCRFSSTTSLGAVHLGYVRKNWRACILKEGLCDTVVAEGDSGGWGNVVFVEAGAVAVESWSAGEGGSPVEGAAGGLYDSGGRELKVWDRSRGGRGSRYVVAVAGGGAFAVEDSTASVAVLSSVEVERIRRPLFLHGGGHGVPAWVNKVY